MDLPFSLQYLYPIQQQGAGIINPYSNFKLISFLFLDPMRKGSLEVTFFSLSMKIFLKALYEHLWGPSEPEVDRKWTGSGPEVEKKWTRRELEMNQNMSVHLIIHPGSGEVWKFQVSWPSGHIYEMNKQECEGSTGRSQLHSAIFNTLECIHPLLRCGMFQFYIPCLLAVM